MRRRAWGALGRGRLWPGAGEGQLAKGASCRAARLGTAGGLVALRSHPPFDSQLRRPPSTFIANRRYAAHSIVYQECAQWSRARVRRRMDKSGTQEIIHQLRHVPRLPKDHLERG